MRVHGRANCHLTLLALVPLLTLAHGRFPWAIASPQTSHSQRAEGSSSISSGSSPPCFPHPAWQQIGKWFYLTLEAAPAPFYEGISICQQNHATLAYPTSNLSLHYLLRLPTAHYASTFLGVTLPASQPRNVTCAANQCDSVLRLSTGEHFTHQPWMQDHFDRAPGQHRCFKAVHKGLPAASWPVPTPCNQPLRIVCQALCPPSTVPIQLPPLELQHKSLPASRTLPRSSRDQAPALNTTLAEFLAPPHLNHSLLQPAVQHNTSKAEPVSNDPRSLIGFDCTTPLDIQPFQADTRHKACTIPSEPRAQRNQSILLLQKANSLLISTKQCRVTQTIIPFHCGAFSHNSFAASFLQFEETVPVSGRECEDLWESLSYKDPKQVVHQLRPNETTRIYYQSAGRNEIVNGETTCQGGDYLYKGITFTDMVVTVARKFELYTQPASVNDDHLVHVLRPDIILSCLVNKEHCSSVDHGTFIWKAPAGQQACRYHILRRVHGIIITDQFGVDVFMSTDNSLIRLVLTDSTSKCGNVVLTTNYRQLFVSLDLHTDAFPANLPVTDYSAFTYANQQDGWLLGFLTNYIRREFQAVHLHACQQRMNEGLTNYETILAAQHGSTDGDTAQLDNGYFVTVAGEAWYRHRCRRILVTAVSLKACYSAIPITLATEDDLRYRHLHNLNASTQLFLEPHSRRLTERGIEVDCSLHFPPLYRGLNNNWLSLTPEVGQVGPPAILTHDDLTALRHNPPDDFDFDGGGIYTATDIGDIARKLHAQRAVLDVGSSLGRQAQSSAWLSGSDTSSAAAFTPGMLFAPLASMVSFNPLQWIWSTILAWGQFVSVLMGIYYAGFCIVWCTNCARRTALYPINPGQNLLRHLWGTAFPPDNQRPRQADRPSPTGQDMPLQPAQESLGRTDPATEQNQVELTTTSVKYRPSAPNQHQTSRPPDTSPPPRPQQNVRFSPHTTARYRTLQKGLNSHHKRAQANHYATPRKLYPYFGKFSELNPVYYTLPLKNHQKWEVRPLLQSANTWEADQRQALKHDSLSLTEFPPLNSPPRTKVVPNRKPSDASSQNTDSTTSEYTKQGLMGSSLSLDNQLQDLAQQEYERLVNGFDLALTAIPADPPARKEHDILRTTLAKEITDTYDSFKRKTTPLKQIEHWDNMLSQYNKRIKNLINLAYDPAPNST